MPQYMIVLGGVDAERRAATAAEHGDVMHKYIAWTQMLREKGHYVDSHKLFDQQGRSLRLKDGRVLDGPFVESKETLGGYYIVEAQDLDEAVRWARECPTLLQGGYVDVRAIEI